MQQDGLNFDHLKEEYVICICEGAAEQAIIELLLDHNSLVFAHDNLVGREVTRKRKSSEIQSSFLNRAYQRRVNILRILDSKKDSFKLPPLYAERYPVHNIYTRPEIEMLLIIAEGQVEKYLQKVSWSSVFVTRVSNKLMLNTSLRIAYDSRYKNAVVHGCIWYKQNAPLRDREIPHLDTHEDKFLRSSAY